MSGILPAPFIKEKLPAQYGGTLIFPFTLNRAVGENDFQGIQLKIKTVSTNIIVDTISAGENAIKAIGNGEYEVLFNIAQDNIKKYTEGQFYKAQIAFISKQLIEGIEEKVIGDFSMVGVFKYTSIPSVILLDSKNKEFQNFDSISNILIGAFSTDDITEKLAEYRFQIYEENGALFDDSQFLVHDIANDDNFIDKDTDKVYSVDTYTIKKELKTAKNYYVVYSIKTINGAIIESKEYWMRPSFTISIQFPGHLRIKEYREEGYFAVQAVFDTAKFLSGSFRIMRTDEHSNFSEWEILYNLSFANRAIYKGEILDLFKDFTIEQNIKYKYAIQQYSNNLSSEKIPCYTLITPEGYETDAQYFSMDFEDMFLFDGERQLKIKYNPKVSSFKNIILENKIETIGNKYPFFFRNGNVKYKEFPISGLISRLEDEEHTFIEGINYNKNLDKTYINRDATPSINTKVSDLSTNLTSDNITKEREFKLKVLDWLSDGKPKLFRSATEGNYIVRLMNVSLSPIDKLGRMLHTFQATAYEVSDYNFENLSKNNFFNKEIHLLTNPKQGIKNISLEKSTLPSAIYARIFDGTPGDEIVFTYNNGKQVNIILGLNGLYDINIDNNDSIIDIQGIYLNPNSKAKLEYFYIETDSSELFYDKNNREMSDFSSFNKVKQFIGNNEDSLEIKTNLYYGNNILKTIVFEKPLSYDLINKIPVYSQVYQLENIPYVRILKKPIEYIWWDDNKKIPCNDILKNNPVKPRTTVLYFDNATGVYSFYDGLKFHKLNEEKPLSYNYIINNRLFHLNSGRIEMDLSGYRIDNFLLGNGLYLDIFYYGSSYKVKNKEKEA